MHEWHALPVSEQEFWLSFEDARQEELRKILEWAMTEKEDKQTGEIKRTLDPTVYTLLRVLGDMA